MEHGQLLAFTGGPPLTVMAVPQCKATPTGHEALLASLKWYEQLGEKPVAKMRLRAAGRKL